MTTAKKGAPTKYNRVKDIEFARRLNTACDNHPHVPEMYIGRHTWIRDMLKDRFSCTVSAETVRKWFAGISLPRPDKMALLAQGLSVDLAWLSLGVAQTVSTQDKAKHSAKVSGAVNVVAGLMQMTGGHPAFPSEEDAAANKDAHLLAIINGTSFKFHVALASETKNGLSFEIPARRKGLRVVGVVQTPDTTDVTLLDLDEESLKKFETGKAPYMEVKATAKGKAVITRNHTWKAIKSFKSAYVE